MFEKNDEYGLKGSFLKALHVAQDAQGSAGDLERLGAEFGGEVARWTVGQWELRRRGAAKFERAGEMLFTREGLEMATHERVAEWHASLFPERVEVVDLSCGIGADLVALGQRGPVVGVDLNPDHVGCARWNLGVHGVEGTVVEGDGLAWGREHRPEFVFVDPARRKEGKRLDDPGDFSPSLADLEEVLAGARRAVIKLSPMLGDSFLGSFGGDLWFVSFGGECREAVVVLGEGVSGARRAVRVDTGAILAASIVGETVYEPGRFVVEGDPAAVRGHCLGGFGMAALGDSPGWLTGNELVESEWLTGFEVLWSGGWKAKRVGSVLREMGGRVSVVKTRGVREEPREVMRSLKEYGEREVELMLFREGKSVRAVLVERV